MSSKHYGVNEYTRPSWASTVLLVAAETICSDQFGDGNDEARTQGLKRLTWLLSAISNWPSAQSAIRSWPLTPKVVRVFKQAPTPVA